MAQPTIGVRPMNAQTPHWGRSGHAALAQARHSRAQRLDFGHITFV
jgi:hypothetical protein